jgi:hypothetical protein
MADSDRDQELMRAAAQHAQRQALQEINNEAESVRKTWAEQIARGDSSGAAWSWRAFAALKSEYDVIAGSGQQQQQQAPQQQQVPQQQQSGFTPEEQAWIEANPHVWNDPEKRSEAIKAANSLVMRGYRRGSPEYLAGIEHWIGLRDADGGDALPIINDSEVARISKSKYGDTTPDEIRQGQERLAELKRYGLYRMDQS